VNGIALPKPNTNASPWRKNKAKTQKFWMLWTAGIQKKKRMPQTTIIIVQRVGAMDPIKTTTVAVGILMQIEVLREDTPNSDINIIIMS
jgi:hypothetical protein